MVVWCNALPESYLVIENIGGGAMHRRRYEGSYV
jgi:hypothetical protein